MPDYFLTAFRKKMENSKSKEEEGNIDEIDSLLETENISHFVNEGYSDCTETILEIQDSTRSTNKDVKPECTESNQGGKFLSFVDATKRSFSAHMTTAKTDAEVLLTQAKNTTSSIFKKLNSQGQESPNNVPGLQNLTFNNTNAGEQLQRSYKVSSLKRITSYQFITTDEQQDIRSNNGSSFKKLTSSLFNKTNSSQQARPDSSDSIDYGDDINVLDTSSCVYKATTIELEQKSIKDVFFQLSGKWL